MKKSLGFWMLCIIWFNLTGQGLHAQSGNERSLQAVPFTVLETTDQNLKADQVLQRNSAFEPPSQLKLTAPNKMYWILLDFSDYTDTLQTKSSWKLRTSFFDEAELYYIKDGNLVSTPFGYYNAIEPSTSVVHFPSISFTKSNLIKNRHLLIKVKLYSIYSNIAKWGIGFLGEESDKFYSDYYSGKELNLLLIDYMYLGACLILFLTFLTIFLNVGRMEFLYYSLYLLSSCLFLMLHKIAIPWNITLAQTPVGNWLSVISQVLFNLFYTAFVLHYLDIKKVYPFLYRPTMVVIATLLAIMVLDAAFLFSKHYSLHLLSLDFERILMTVYGLFIMIYLSLKAKDRLAFFVVAGSFVFMLGGILFLFTINRYYMVVGSGVEIIIFSLGLAYKVKSEYEENIALQREVSLKEGSVLRAQMNPHFIFNSLNSIQHLILNNNKISALKYLSRFGKLTRNILESSVETTALLSEEIELLKSYLELESLRFEDTFSYKINVAEDLEPDDIEVPLFLIQPYAENAIVHGLLPKEKGEKLLTISFERQKNNIICSVEDNGVGRTESQNKKSSPKTKKRSRGMAITEKRLELLTSSEIGNSTVEIIDKYDENGNPAGTKVVIQILEALKTRI
ncbi:MAG: histidine kinase [Bacteroidota bacterium]